MPSAIGRHHSKLKSGIEELSRELLGPTGKCLDVDEHIEIKPMGQAIARMVKLLEIFSKEK